MKVDKVCMWVGRELPEKYQGPGPFEITPEEFESLSKDHDVAIMHDLPMQPSQRQLRQGAKPVPSITLLCIDEFGRRFHQR